MKIFYPTNAGKTKEGIVDMINDRIVEEIEGWPDKVDINKLTDERTQQFVNKWQDLLERGFVYEMVQIYAGHQEEELRKLANEIAV